MAGKVPETILKKRRRNDEWAAKKAAAAAEASKKAKATRQLTFKKAQAYAKEYLQQVRGRIRRLCARRLQQIRQPAAPSCPSIMLHMRALIVVCDSWSLRRCQLRSNNTFLNTFLIIIPPQPQEKDLIRLKREAKANKGMYVEPEAKLLFVIRIRGINDMHPKVGRTELPTTLHTPHTHSRARSCSCCD